MKNIKLKPIVFEEKVVIHCPEEWQDKIIRELAHEKGCRWLGSPVNLIDESRWSKYKNSYCIKFKDGGRATCAYYFKYYEEIDYKIIPFQDAIQVYLHEQPLNIGDVIYLHDKYDFIPYQYMGIHRRESVGLEVFLLSKDDRELLIGINNTNTLESLLWQNPYEITDEWRVKPKQKRDFSKYIHWEDKPEKATRFAVDKYGSAYWYDSEPVLLGNCWSVSLYSAGYRPQLLNEDGIVEDWRDSLIDLSEIENKNK